MIEIVWMLSVREGQDMVPSYISGIRQAYKPQDKDSLNFFLLALTKVLVNFVAFCVLDSMPITEYWILEK